MSYTNNIIFMQIERNTLQILFFTYYPHFFLQQIFNFHS